MSPKISLQRAKKKENGKRKRRIESEKEKGKYIHHPVKRGIDWFTFWNKKEKYMSSPQ
jgi:hypothetical protein